MRAAAGFAAAPFCLAILAAAPARAALVVSKAPTSNVSCVSGICAATAADAVLNVGDLKRLLAAGDVSVVSGSTAGDIDFDAKLQWTKPSRLTLDAWRGLAISLDITSEGTGGVTLTTNDGGSGGDLVFTGKGKVSFWDTSSGLIVNGTAYTLVDSIQSLASAIAADPNGAYALSRYYDASADGTYASDPVPGAFGGTFEGLGHVIANLKLGAARGTQDGFFADVAAGGIVRDVSFDNASLNGKGALIGAVAALNAGAISHVSADVAIQAPGGGGGGGLVGANQGTISWCAVSGSFTASGNASAAGGLVGTNAGTILHSHSSVAVQAHNAAALVGGNTGLLSLSYATGAVGTDGIDYDSSFASGLVLENYGTIDRSFAAGPINGGQGGQGGNHGHHQVSAYAAGVVIFNYGTVTDTYSAAALTIGIRSRYAGFVVASQSSGSIASSYSSGPIVRDGKQGRFGFVWESSNGANDYWDIDTTGTAIGCGDGCTGVTGLTNAQFQSGLPTGFDPSVWAQSPDINGGLPYLIANPPQ